MAGLALAGMDYRAFLCSHDRVERQVTLAVAEKVIEARRHNSEQRRQALAVEIGNGVGKIVGEAMQNIARAMR